jgi:copper transport protein
MLHDSVSPALLTRRRPSGLAASVCAAVAITATVGWASVHTRLESSVPAADEVLTVSPEHLELRFSGPVNEALSAAVLLFPTGDSVHIALRTAGDDNRFLVGSVPDLEDGEYLVRWRTVSADGHAVTGEFRFTLTGASLADGDGEPQLPATTQEAVTPSAAQPAAAVPGEATPAAGVVLLAGLGMVCLLGFAGLLWYCGSLPLLREPRIERATLALGWAALLLLAGDLIGWVMGVVPPGAGLAGIAAATGSNTGLAGLGRTALIALALLLLRRRGRAAAALALTAVVIGAASGHAAAISPWITMPAKAIHLGSVSIWLGGLLLLVVAPDGPTDETHAWQFIDIARAVSATALLAVILILASGMVQSARFVGEFSAFTGTPYGRGVLLKWTGMVVLVGFGAYHRFRVMPALERGGDGRGLRRTVRLETIVMLAVVMVATWLARVSPPAGH